MSRIAAHHRFWTRLAFSSSPTEVNNLLSSGLALLATVGFYLLVVEPFRRTYFGQLLAERGWVQYAIMFLTFWALFTLLLKRLKLQRQQMTLRQDFLPTDLGERITAENAPRFRDFIKNHCQEQENSFLLYRLEQALHFFGNRHPLQYIRHHLNFQAEADANAVEGSYAMLKVIVWAIPILGFIGTVLGIGMAVAGFSDAINDVQALAELKRSLGKVTVGLGIAFDTTFLALLVSLFIMFLCSSLQKAEEEFLAGIERYCSDHLLSRMDEFQGHSSKAQDDLLRSVQKILSNQEAQIARLERAVVGRTTPGEHGQPRNGPGA